MLDDPLGLVARPWIFSQQFLLDADEFERKADERGVILPKPALERLDKAGVLRPLYVVTRPAWDIRARRRASSWGETDVRRWSPSKDGQGLAEDVRDGLVADGAAVPFRTWSKDVVRTSIGDVFRRREPLYSPFQLLTLPDAEAARTARGGRRRRDQWTDGALEALGQREAASRRLTILLSLLEVHFLPDITWHEHAGLRAGFKELTAFRRSLDPALLLTECGWTTSDLEREAARLLHLADSRDPLRDWVLLVRQIHPDEWARLRGAARLAMDFRIAAEMILLFLDALIKKGAAPAREQLPRRAPHPLRGRLKRDRADLDEILMDYGLSPYPAVVLGLEGDTEMEMVPRAMEALDIPRRDSFIQLVNCHGEDRERDHAILATFAALPRLGPREGEGALFRKPPTHYMVVVDGDRNYRRAADRERLRDHLVEVIAGGLPAEFRTPEARADLDHMVHVETWKEGFDLERANFTDREIAQALMEGWTRSVSEADLRRQLAQSRADRRQLEEIWRRWRPQPSKPALGQLLWPVLEKRIASAVGSQPRLVRIPIARVLDKAWELAVRTHRRHVLMRVGRAPA